jgi:uncharacterized caspase-like protein
MRGLVFVLLLCTGLTAGATVAFAEKRVALIVGNANYLHIARLDNPTNDARLIAGTLRALGFALVGDRALIDLDKPAFDSAVQRFGKVLQGADVGLFYYAGHGVQVRGANYLVPVGANPVREADIDFEMLDTALVLRQMEASGTRLNLVILDACRNNPFGGRGLRSTVSGLAQMVAPEGTLISFSTQPGNVALDGRGENSPYALALAQTIQRPGLDIFRTFNEVGLTVKRATAGAQQPWVSSSPIAGNFYFAGAPASQQLPPLAAPAQQSAASAASPGVSSPPASEAEHAWGAIKDTTSVAVLEEFVRQFGDTVHGNLARARLGELRGRQTIAAAAPAEARDATDGAATVQAFYTALAAGDGDTAARWVIPEKRQSGPFSAAAMTKFYGRLVEPLRLTAVESIAPNEFRARYTYVAPASRRCDGVAIIRTTRRNGVNLIGSIKALAGC